MDKAYIYFSLFKGKVKGGGLRRHLLVRGEEGEGFDVSKPVDLEWPFFLYL